MEIERCLRQNKIFIRDADGHYFLNKHLEHDATEAADIRQMCFEFLSSENQILGSDDLLERLAAEGPTIENLSNDIHATLLRNDATFDTESGISIQADEHSH